MNNGNSKTTYEFQALEQVLEAEKAAHRQLDTARAQAEKILQAARGKSSQIETRTDRRIQALHGRFRKNLANKKNQLEEGFQLEIRALEKSIGTGKFKDVTNKLARQLVGIAGE